MKTLLFSIYLIPCLQPDFYIGTALVIIPLFILLCGPAEAFDDSS